MNEFYVTVVTTGYWNTSEVFANPHLTEYYEYDSRRFRNMLEKFNTSSPAYETLTPLNCTKLYNTDLMSSHRDLFLIAKRSSNVTQNSTFLDTIYVPGDGTSPSNVFYGDAALRRDVAQHGNHRNIKCTFYFLHN